MHVGQLIAAAIVLIAPLVSGLSDKLTPISLEDDPSVKIPSLLLTKSAPFDVIRGKLRQYPEQNIEGCSTPTEIEKDFFAGVIALIRRGNCTIEQKIEYARSSKAQAVIIYGVNDDTILDVVFDVPGMVGVLVGLSQGAMLRTIEAEGKSIKIDSLYGVWKNTPRCTDDESDRSILSGCLAKYVAASQQHYGSAHACNNAAGDIFRLKTCVEAVSPQCSDELYEDCQKRNLTESFAFNAFVENYCFPIPHSCDVLWKLDLTGTFVDTDPYNHAREGGYYLSQMECDPDAFYDPKFPFNARFAYEWGYDSSSRQALPGCAWDAYRPYIKSINDLVANQSSDAFAGFCREHHLTFYRKLVSCFPVQCRRNMRYRCLSGRYSKLYHFRLEYFDKLCGISTCKEILDYRDEDVAQEYECKVNDLWSIIGDHEPYPSYRCGYRNKLYLGCSIGAVVGLVVILLFGRWADLAIIAMLGVLGLFLSQAFRNNIDSSTMDTTEDLQYDVALAWWYGTITAAVVFLVFRTIATVFERVIVYDLVLMKKRTIRYGEAFFRSAVISWRWDIDDAAEFERSPTLRDCFATAKNHGFRYALVDVVTLSQDSISASAVLKFMNAYGLQPVVVAIKNEDMLEAYKKRFWCNVEIMMYNSSPRKVILLGDGLDRPSTYFDLRDIVTTNAVTSKVNLDRLTVFLLMVPFGDALLQLPLDEIQHCQEIKRDLPLPIIRELIDWSRQVTHLSISFFIVQDGIPMFSYRNPLSFWFWHGIWFMLICMPTNIWFMYTMPTLLRRDLLYREYPRENTEMNQSLFLNGFGTDDRYLKILGIVHPILFGLIVGLGGPQIGYGTPVLFSTIVLPVVLRGAIIFSLGHELRRRIQFHIATTNVTISVSLNVPRRDTRTLRTKISEWAQDTAEQVVSTIVFTRQWVSHGWVSHRFSRNYSTLDTDSTESVEMNLLS